MAAGEKGEKEPAVQQVAAAGPSPAPAAPSVGTADGRYLRTADQVAGEVVLRLSSAAPSPSVGAGPPAGSDFAAVAQSAAREFSQFGEGHDNSRYQVGHADDAAESDADRIAQGALQRMSARPIAEVGSPMGASTVQRSSLPEVGVEGGGLRSETANELDRARQGGRPLGEGVRRSFESAFDQDLSHVRVHDDPQAHNLSDRIQASAFTTGSDVFFSRGAYQPDSSAGQHLLAHELAHVVQQGGGLQRRFDPVQRASSAKPAEVDTRASPDFVIRRVINDADGLPVTKDVIATYEGDKAQELQDVLIELYYEEESDDIALTDLAEALYDLADTNEALGSLLEAGVDFNEVVEEVERLHNNSPVTLAAREEAEENEAQAADSEKKAALKKASDEKSAKERASKTKQRTDILAVMPAFAATGDAALKTIVENGLASSEGIDKTLDSGLTMSADRLRTLKTRWIALGRRTDGRIQTGVDLTPVSKMWSPGTSADVGKKKIRAAVIDHNVNFMFRISYVEGGSAEFNIHVNVDEADWI